MTANPKNQAARVVGKNGFSLISDDKFRELYGALLQCVMLDGVLTGTEGYERWVGREASSAGISACLRPGDTITPTPRSLLARYLQMKSLTMPDDYVADQPLAAATGDGLRHKLAAQENVAVVFAKFDDPKRAQQAFTIAVKQALPIFYILDGDPDLAKAAGSIPVIRVDGADTVAVYRVAHESIERARKGGGPTIMECASWPGSDAHGPLDRLEEYLPGRKLLRDGWKRRFEKELDIEIKKKAIRGD